MVPLAAMAVAVLISRARSSLQLRMLRLLNPQKHVVLVFGASRALRKNLREPYVRKINA